MKTLNKRAVIVSIVTLLAVPSISFAAWGYTHQPKKAQDKQSVVAREVVSQSTVDPVEATPTTPVSETTPVSVPAAQPPAPVAPAPVTPTPPPAPVVLSTQEYAEKYLDLSGEGLLSGQRCFDIIVAHFPERFLESNREASIRALTIYGGHQACTAIFVNGDGYRDTDDFRATTIYKYGANGEFFDKFAR